MPNICDNPKCQFHLPCPRGLETARSINVFRPSPFLAQHRLDGTTPRRENDQVVCVDRFVFGDSISPLMVLCDCCATAVRMSLGAR